MNFMMKATTTNKNSELRAMIMLGEFIFKPGIHEPYIHTGIVT